jgi:hypothetical protein
MSRVRERDISINEKASLNKLQVEAGSETADC